MIVPQHDEATMKGPWWQTGVIYQIYPRSFQDSDGDGIGDLEGIRRRLDYLSDTLGVDAIWLSPFYPSPMADFGYDVSEYCNVDPIFGTLDDFDRLLAEAHARELKVIIDWVPNHTSDRHPWFEASRSSRDDPKRNWYVWADPNPDGSPPNNWQSVFGGPAWEWDENTHQYYLHSFLAEQPDLNWRNPAVEAAMLDTLRFWLDRGVDGFRMDVVAFIMKDPGLRDDPQPPTDEPLRSRAHDDVHAEFRKIRSVLDSYDPPRFSIGEIHEPDWGRWASYYGRHLDELHMPFNFTLLHAPWNAGVIRRLVDACDASVPPGAWPNYVLGNHDTTRLATRLGSDRARVAAMLLLTLRGTPTLYYGDELGMEQADIPPELQQDPWGRRMPGMGRDGCRTPMEWDTSPHAGFTDGVPWLPVAEGSRLRSVAVQGATSILGLYQGLLRLRRRTPALRAGAYRSLDAPPGCFVYERSLGPDRFIVALNFEAEPRTVNVEGTVLLSTGLDRDGWSLQHELRPNEGLIIEL
ncbi:oligo-1,6-glucosidase 1 [bacterium BMS3Abin02]|nr:oligo-1,6-glucosidase 1 [bacterium BMS3Abin02]GBE22522.1 oligo-1,6-glucosidase 1 [bacterium BMS3Bbin01]